MAQLEIRINGMNNRNVPESTIKEIIAQSLSRLNPGNTNIHVTLQDKEMNINQFRNIYGN